MRVKNFVEINRLMLSSIEPFFLYFPLLPVGYY
jgi:hypothetical protein